MFVNSRNELTCKNIYAYKNVWYEIEIYKKLPSDDVYMDQNEWRGASKGVCWRQIHRACLAYWPPPINIILIVTKGKGGCE